MQTKFQYSAILIGFVVFVAVYAAGGMLVVFSLSLLPDSIDTETAMLFLRVGGYMALAFPAYVAARSVDNNIMFYALLMGTIEGIGVVVLMMNTFSFEGGLQQFVISRMFPVFIGVMLLSFIAGVIAKRVGRGSLNRLEKK